MTKKELIFNAGVKLFAQRAFDSVGIRDIAAEAGVNSAMISYYFGGKAGLLRTAFQRYVDLILTRVKAAFAKARTPEEICEYLVRELMTDAKKYPDLYKLGLKRLNRETKEVDDLRDEMVDEGWKHFSMALNRMGITGVRYDDELNISFTVIMGMIFSDYILEGGLYTSDDVMAEKYIRVVTSIMQRGVVPLWK